MKQILLTLVLLGAASRCGGVTPLPNDSGPMVTPVKGAGGTGGSQPVGTLAGGSGGSAGVGGSTGTGGVAGGGGSTGGGGGAGAGGAKHDAGGATDAPVSADGPAGAACGPNRCAGNQYCCNASCGLCAPRGAACIAIVCERDAGGGACSTDADCRLFDDYCTGCDCRALARSEPDPTCPGPGVACLRQPCGERMAACVRGRCAVVPRSSDGGRR